MKRTSRYLKLLQRVPFAESGYKERYFENSKFLQRNRITPWSCIPTALIGNAETMMGAPITAQEYRWLSVSFGVPVNDAQKSVPLNYFLKGKMQYEQKKYENQRVVLRTSNANRGRSNSSRLDPKPP